MPLYEYECLQCGERFEEICKFSDPLLTQHEECGGELRKLLSPPAIQFKGTGWYVTDYAGKKSGESEEKKEPSKKTSSEKSSPSSKDSSGSAPKDTKGKKGS